MKECEFGSDIEAQKDCENYDPKDPKKNQWECFMFRDLNGLYHCDGLNDKTKRENET